MRFAIYGTPRVSVGSAADLEEKHFCISRGRDEDEDDGFRDERRQRNGTERWLLFDETADASTATRVRRSRRRRPRESAST